MSNNWQQAVQSYVMQNPKLKGIMGLLNSNGNWQQIAQVMAQQTGTDLKQLVQELQS